MCILCRTAVEHNPEKSVSFPLLRLPLELRRRIYFCALLDTPSPPPESIYLKQLPDGWKDLPSCLLQVSKQVRAEVLDTAQTLPISLRVDHQGIHFNTLGQTSLIAQQLPRDIRKISHLALEIWPPHPDRPTDAISIWKHLRKF